MKQTSSLTRNLASAQELHAARKLNTQSAICYRLFTEDVAGLVDIVKRYFSGATFTYGVGLWQGAIEGARVIEIIATSDDLQNIIHLAGDIRVSCNQGCVLITWTPVTSYLSVTE